MYVWSETHRTLTAQKEGKPAPPTLSQRMQDGQHWLATNIDRMESGGHWSSVNVSLGTDVICGRDLLWRFSLEKYQRPEWHFPKP
jgi:hypothetical protein